MFELRALSGDDTSAYNTCLRSAVERHPQTLRISPDDIAAAPFVIASPERAVTVVAHDGGRWLGVGTVEREVGRTKRRHIAWVVRMVALEQNRGVGRRILRELIRRAWEWPDVAKLNLTVAADNAGALHLYESEGFEVFSREDDAFRTALGSVTELTLSLRRR